MHLNYFLSPMLENVTGMSFFSLESLVQVTQCPSLTKDNHQIFLKINLREAFGFFQLFPMP